MKIDQFKGDFGFLSNFYPCEIVFDGATYTSVEHAYQAAKTMDLEQRETIRLAPNAKQAKRLGKALSLRHDWGCVKLHFMEEFLRQKFGKDPLREMLIATEGFELVEGNWWGDIFWGVCNGKGENYLGQLLMKIRSELMALDKN